MVRCPSTFVQMNLCDIYFNKIEGGDKATFSLIEIATASCQATILSLVDVRLSDTNVDRLEPLVLLNESNSSILHKSSIFMSQSYF